MPRRLTFVKLFLILIGILSIQWCQKYTFGKGKTHFFSIISHFARLIFGRDWSKIDEILDCKVVVEAVALLD
jgi:hypothetical protein